MRQRTTLLLFVLGVVLLGAGLLGAPSAAHGDVVGELAFGLAVLLTAAKLGGAAAVRLGQPAVLGELVAGVALGNLVPAVHALGDDPVVDMLAQLGVLLLLFEVGLESTVPQLFAVGGSALLVASLGTTVSFGAGYAAAWALGAPNPLFLGAAITATSVGITARVLRDLGLGRSPEARVILGAAIVDDVLALVALALVSGAQDTAQLPAVVAKTLGFLIAALAVGGRLTRRWFRHAATLGTPGTLVAVGLVVCFFLAWGAGAIGLAPMVGAFAAGLVLEEAHSAAFVERGEQPLDRLLQPITAFLVPIFFVISGVRTDLRAVDPGALGLAAALTVAAFVGKAACGLGAPRGVRRRTVAAAMFPRGEVSLIFGSVGLANGLIDAGAFSALVAMVLVTTLVTPAAIKAAVGPTPPG